MNWTKENLDELAEALREISKRQGSGYFTHPDIVTLQNAATDLPKILAALGVALASLNECDEAMEYMSEYDIPLNMPERVKEALQAIKEVRE